MNWIKIKSYLRNFLDWKRHINNFQERILHPGDSNQLRAISIGFGVFMGIVPVWGFQTLIALFLAVVLRLNKGLVVLASQVSMPPFIPFVIYLSYRTGTLWFSSSTKQLTFDPHHPLKTLGDNLIPYLYGSLTLAVAAGTIVGLIAFFLFSLKKKVDPLADR